MTSRLSKAPTASTNNRDLILILIHQERHIHKRHRLTIIAFIHRASIPQSHPSGQQRTSRSATPPKTHPELVPLGLNLGHGEQLVLVLQGYTFRPGC